MPIPVTCPDCGARFTASDAAAGRSVTCPKCGVALPAPAVPVLDRVEVVAPEVVTAEVVAPARVPARRPPPPPVEELDDADDGDDDPPRRDERDESDRPRWPKWKAQPTGPPVGVMVGRLALLFAAGVTVAVVCWYKLRDS